MNTPSKGPWDLFVIGGGSAGIVAAKTAAGFGASVLLVERERPGGDCLWTGCVPSKALLAAADAAANARDARRFGVHVTDVNVDFGEVMAHVHGAIAAIEPDDSPQTLNAAGVQVRKGSARLTGPRTADVDGTEVVFRQAVLATGSTPVLPPIPGLAECEPLTSDTVWSLTRLPDRLLVLGGGSIGCELGQAFARLGAQVSLVEAAPRLLLREDPAAAGLVTDSLRQDGIDVRLDSAVTALEPRGGGGGWAELANGEKIEFDSLLVAVGRVPRSRELGLEAAGVATDERGYVQVDRHLRTTNPRIWAAGDVTGHPQFTHTAGMHGSLAASNAILGLRRRADLTAMPRVTYTQPELAAVGVGTASEPERPGLHIREVLHDHVDRAVTEANTGGLSRLVLDQKGRVLGATIVSPRAGESLAELVLAVRRGMRTSDLAGTIHAYPTYGDGPWNAAITDVQGRLHRPTTARGVSALSSLRRRWLDARARLGGPGGAAEPRR